MSGGAIPFRKMNGLGNEFIVFDARRGPVRLPPTRSARSASQDAIGFDQMITIERSKNGADAFMRIHNRDGGEVDACGNATRCVGWLLMGETGQQERDHRDQRRAAARLRHRQAGDDHRRHGQAALRAGTRSRSPRNSATRARSNCRSGRSTRRSCIRRRSSTWATRTRSSGSTTSRPTTSRASGRCSRTTRSFPSAPTSRSPT